MYASIAFTYDLLFLGALVVPLAAVHLASWRLCRGFTLLRRKPQARRAYLMSWWVSLGLLSQIGGAIWVLLNWGERMPLTLGVADTVLDGIVALIDLTGKWPTVIIATSLAMLLLTLNTTAFAMAWMRIDRLANASSGNRIAASTQARLSIRSVFVSSLPIALWSAGITAMPGSVLSDPGLLALLFTGFLFAAYSLAPLLVQCSYPTEALPADHPVSVMARDLCRAANVRISSIRRLNLGEARIANAMVAGLLPGYRCIYVSDRLLETFTPAEVRSILAHEIGHVKMRHLWCNLAFGVVAGLVLTPLAIGLASLLGLSDSFLPSIVLLVVWWSVVFSYCARRFERAADLYAVELTGSAPAFMQALEKLAEVNCAVRTWGKWDIFQGHPDIAGRIASVSRLV